MTPSQPGLGHNGGRTDESRWLEGGSEREHLEGMGQSERRWIVVAFEGGDPETDAVIVRASSEEEAAGLGATWLQEQFDRDTDGGAEVNSVFVEAWDERRAYSVERRFAVTRSPFQCCGGGPGIGLEDHGGHWGGCPGEVKT